MALSQGDVILVPFPYRDRLAEKTRPAVVVFTDAFNLSGDVIVAAVTSHSTRGPFDIELGDWKAAGLQRPSTVRMLLATMSDDRVALTIGSLSSADWLSVQGLLKETLLLDGPAPS